MANTYQLIASVTVGSGGALSVDFTSIPQTYSDLVLKVSIRNTGTDGNVVINLNSLTFRADIGNARNLLGVSGGSAISQTGAGPGYSLYSNVNAHTANTFSSSEIYIPNYTSTNHKAMSSDSAQEDNSTDSIRGFLAILMTLTDPITFFSISSSSSATPFVENSTFYLYGIKKS
jgi:hypothetical protein